MLNLILMNMETFKVTDVVKGNTRFKIRFILHVYQLSIGY